MNIIRCHPNWPPLENLSQIRGVIESALRYAIPENRTWAPRLDISESEDSLNIQVDVPGMKKEDFDISLVDGAITISGTRAGATESAFRNERQFGPFTRCVQLPSPVKSDTVAATYENGVLSITLHKADEAKPRKINIA